MKLRVKDYRRAMVVLVGGFHLVIGSAQVLSAPSRSTGGGFAWLPTHLDADELGWLWIVAGLTMLGCAVEGLGGPSSVLYRYARPYSLGAHLPRVLGVLRQPDRSTLRPDLRHAGRHAAVVGGVA